jgi:hypothetical protein
MALDFANVSFGATWQQTKANTGFANTVQGPDGLALNASLSVGSSSANSIYVAQGTLAASASTTIDLYSFTDQLGQSIAMVRVYALVVKTTGDTLKIEPGASNPLTWFLGGTSPSISIPAGGGMTFYQPTAATASSTARNIKLSNTGSVTLTYDIAIIGGP